MWRGRERDISAGKRTLIDSIVHVQRERGKSGCIHIRGKSRDGGKVIWVKDIQHDRERTEGEEGGGGGLRTQHWVNDLLYDKKRERGEETERKE